MCTKKFRVVTLIGWVLLLSPFGVTAQQAVEEYPAPRYPQLKESYSAEELLAIARTVVKKPSLGPGPGNYQGRDAANIVNIGYNIQSGERVLLSVDRSFDPRVRDAMAMAIREAGGNLDVVITHAPSVGPVRDGAAEARRLLQPRQRQSGAAGFSRSNLMETAERGNYQLFIFGGGGAVPLNIPYRWELIPWNTLDKFVTGAADYPYELQEAIDQKVWETMLKARRVRVTDPAGTDISWTVSGEGYQEAGARKHFGIAIRGHVGLWPNNFLPEAQPPDAEGVIAGTVNHTGVFPHIKVYLQNQKLVRIEGGGAYAEFWQSLLDKYKDVQWPMHPGPGMSWLREAAIGTNPKAVRPVNVMEHALGPTWETRRSGVIHWGIGVLGVTQGEPGREELLKFARESHLPLAHLHVHTYFNTVEMELEDGRKILLIDKGRLTALDDPEIREIAARYGDPDELLKEAWIPAIPGINVAGDYMDDYGSNPGYWIRQEHRNAYGDVMESYRLH